MRKISKQMRDVATGLGIVAVVLLALIGLPLKAFGSEGIGFVAGIALMALVYWHASQRNPVPIGAPQPSVRPVRLETQVESKVTNGGPYDELRLKHCAIMMGINEGDAVTYLIPCIGNISRVLDAVPDDVLANTLDSAARLRENGIQVKVLIPEGHIAGTAFFPAVSKYTVGVRQFPVPKAFFSGN